MKKRVAESESEDSGLVRDYGLLVVPLDLSKEEAELLIAELKTSGIRAESSRRPWWVPSGARAKTLTMSEPTN